MEAERAFEAEPTLDLKDLDVRGREIAGLEPKPEKFSRLTVGQDVEVLKRNLDIISTTDLDEAFVFVNPSGGTESHLVEAPHWRAISQEGTAMFETERGPEPYYTVNTKGVGYLKPTLKGGHSLDDYDNWARIDEYGETNAYGLGDKVDFESNADDLDLVEKSRFLTEHGFRTELYYAYGKLKNAYYKGELTSIKDLRSRGVIPSAQKLVPEIGIRLMKMDTRIAEAREAEVERAKTHFQKAFEVFNLEAKDRDLDLPELTYGDPASEKVFFDTFFERMGQNLAALQNVGYIGYHMHSANVTLAAEIVDIQPYESWRGEKDNPDFVKEYSGVRRGTLKDMRDVAYDLKMLLSAGKAAGMHIPDRQELAAKCFDAFRANLNAAAVQQERAEPAALEEAFKRIFNAVIVEGKSLPALKHGNDIDDWELGL